VPYRREPPEWMPAKEALAHIRQTDRCSASSAISQLKAAMSDGQIGARLPNQDPKSRHRHPTAIFPPWMKHSIFVGRGPGASPMISIGDRQQPGPKEWRTAEIRANGTARFFGEGWPWYGFEVLREQILRIWPPLRGRSTSAAESRALAWLKRDLTKRGVKSVSKPDRRAHALREFKISCRAFDERVWPRALEETGLRNEGSRAGRKSAR
jgi:hypothetical protein